MAEPLCILHLEEDEAETGRLEATLAAEGLAVAFWRVSRQAELAAALERGGFDLILADYGSQAFDWPAVFALARACWPHVPLIAIDGRGDGASAQVTGERWLPLIHQAARRAQERAEREQAEAGLARHPEHWYWLAEASRAFTAAGLEPVPLLEAVARSAAMVTNSICAIRLLSADGQWLDLAALRRPHQTAPVKPLERSEPRVSASAGLRGQVLATGQPMLRLALSPGELHDALPERTWQELGPRASVSLLEVPLQARGQSLGTLCLTRDDPARPLGPEDVALATDLADRAALALENARLFQRASQAADRLAQLAAVSTALSQALTPAEVARVVLNQGIGVLGAAGANMLTLSDDGQWLTQMANVGYPPRVTQHFQTFPLTTTVPSAEAVRTGEAIWLESAAEHRARYPNLAGDIDAMGYQAAAAVPLRYGGRVIGALGLSFPGVMAFTPETRQFVTTLAGYCAQALERARLFTAEQQARQAAEQVAWRANRQTERVARLQVVTAALSQLLTPPQIVQAVTEHGLPLLGNGFGAIYLLAEDGDGLELVTPPGLELPPAAGLLRHVPLSAALPAAVVMRTGQPLWFETNSALVARYPLMVPVRAATGQQALAAVPLPLDGRLLGVLLFSFAEPQPFDPDEQAYLLTLGRQCAQALERARLLAEAQAHNARLEARVAERTAQLRQVLRQVESWREAERARIAHDVHDELGGSLTGLKMAAVRMLRSYGHLVPESARGEANELITAIDDAVEAVRRIASDLRPAGLDDFGLLAALEAHFDEFRRRAGLAGAFRCQVESLPLTGDTAIGCFRIVQEALTNVARHAQARRVDVTVAVAGGVAVLTVADDGRGLPAQVLSGTGHLGLAGMRERARMFAWDLAVEAQPGKGTVVRLTIPLGEAD